MGDLRKPFFIVALALMALVVLIEIGSSITLNADPPTDAELRAMIEEQFADDLAPLSPFQRELFISAKIGQMREQREKRETPPGLGVPYLALLDGLLLFVIGLMGAALFVPERVHGRIQGVATLIVSLLIIILSIVLIIVAFLLLLLMLSLLAAVPFGTAVYFAVYGFFDRPGASGVLGLLMLLKLAFAVLLVIAHQRFLQNKGLVLLVLTSLVAGIVVGFLHGIVPRPLVSITDAVAAIIIAIIAVIWAIIFLIGSLVSVVKALRPAA